MTLADQWRLFRVRWAALRTLLPALSPLRALSATGECRRLRLRRPSPDASTFLAYPAATLRLRGSVPCFTKLAEERSQLGHATLGREQIDAVSIAREDD